MHLSDINADNFLKKVNKYLTRVVKCEAPANHPLWLDVLSYSWIRNIIIHNDGRVSEQDKIPPPVLRQVKQSSAGLGISHGRIIMKRRFCYRAVRHMAQFLLDVYGSKKENQ